MIITAKLKDGIRFLSLGILSLSGWAAMENVGMSCTLGAVTSGVLVPHATLKAVSNTYTGGTAGSVVVTCLGASTLAVGVPTLVTKPATFSPTVLQAVVQRGLFTAATDYTSANTGGNFDGSTLWTSIATPLALPIGASTLNVNMVVGGNTPGTLPGGLYSYTVSLTVTPN